MKKGKIYCYNIGEKYYVGKTYNEDRKRQKQHKYDANHGTQTPFCFAIRKYGWENVLETYKVLEVLENKTLQDLNYNLIERENYWIDKLNSLLPNGYNVHYSNHKKIPYIPNKEERYNKVSQKLKGRNNNPLLSNRIICVETGIIYPSVREAERVNNFPKNTIGGALNGKKRTAHGFNWKYVDKPTPIFDINKARKKPLVEKHSQKIEVVCLETNKQYESINACVRAFGWSKDSKKGVSKSCKQKTKYRNFNFRFSNYDNPVPSVGNNEGQTTIS